MSLVSFCYRSLGNTYLHVWRADLMYYTPVYRIDWDMPNWTLTWPLNTVRPICISSFTKRQIKWKYITESAVGWRIEHDLCPSWHGISIPIKINVYMSLTTITTPCSLTTQVVPSLKCMYYFENFQGY